MRERRTSRPEPSAGGIPIEGASGLYTLTPPTNEWRHLSAGTLFKNSDLELEKRDAALTVFVYTDTDHRRNLDITVDSRRNKMLGAQPPASTLHERRYFLESGDLVPASLARYAMPADAKVYLVLTALAERATIEVVGLCRSPEHNETELARLIRTFSLKPVATAP